MSMLDFINEYYDVVYKGQDVSRNFSNVEEFLLADNHASIGHSEINSAFINKFSDKNDTVLIEAIASMKPLEKEDAMQSVWLTTSARLLGWDMGNIQDILNSSQLQQTGDLEKKALILVKQIISYEDQGNQDKSAELKLELNKIIRETYILIPALIEHAEAIFKTLENTFSTRVKSMEVSLTEAKNKSKHIFLIAGERHLKPEEDGNCHFSLDSFYKFLENRNVVILSPKPQKVLVAGSRKQQIMQEAALSNIDLIFNLSNINLLYNIENKSPGKKTTQVIQEEDKSSLRLGR